MPKTKTKPCEFCGKRHRTLSRRQCLLGKRRQKGLLWKVLKEALRLRDGGVCQRCGRLVFGDDEHMSHVYRVSRCSRLKYDLQNVKTLCASCHRWWHDYDAEAGVWFKERWPGRWEYLRDKYHEYRQDPGTVPMQWYIEQLEHLRAWCESFRHETQEVES